MTGVKIGNQGSIIRHQGRWIRALALSTLAVLSAGVAAQTAPAGNAHPETHVLSEAHAAFPFGAPEGGSPTPEQKLAFAAALDLDPVRDLAVQHNGRVKILDTLARETVRALTGKAAWAVYVPVDGELEKERFDPLFTLLDMAIDPGFYEPRPMIAIDYLPLRRALVEGDAGPGPEAERELKLGWVSAAAIERHGQGVFERQGASPVWREALRDAEGAVQLLRLGSANLLMVPPATTEKEWHHLAEATGEARAAALELGAAWRALDADRADAALARLSEALPTINPEVYPTTRRSIELAYNRSNAFEWGSWAYLVSFLLLMLAFGTGRRWLRVSGTGVFLLALALHAFGFVARCIVAERFAIQNQFESMTGLSLFAAVVGVVLMLARRQWLFGAAAAGAGFLVLITATQTGIPGSSIEREAAILNTSVLLKYHVTTVLTSYGLITLGMVVSLFYLGAHYGAKWFGRSEAGVVAEGAVGAVGDHRGGKAASGGTRVAGAHGLGSPTTARTLKDLDTAQMVILQLAFWTLGVGILLGAWWADHSWGRWWAFDPKETWALVTWIVYLIVVHVRQAGLRDKGLVTAWLSVVGFIVMLWTYFGVNLLLPGLHAYA